MDMIRLTISKLALSAVVVFGLVASASPADEKAQQFVVCKHQKAVRTLSVLPDSASAASKPGSKACKVTYTKSGVPEEIGSHAPSSSCGSILDHVRNNLEKSNWNCKEVSAATVTTSSEVLKQ